MPAYAPVTAVKANHDRNANTVGNTLVATLPAQWNTKEEGYRRNSK